MYITTLSLITLLCFANFEFVLGSGFKARTNEFLTKYKLTVYNASADEND